MLHITKAILPLLIAKKVYTITIGSIAGEEGYEKGTAYFASKHAVAVRGRAMIVTLLQHSINLTVIYPGATNT